jgi:pyruvate carboxylase
MSGSAWVYDNTGPKAFADQLENALVRDTTADAVHQDVVIDRVEEFRKIDVHGVAVSFSDKLNYLPDSLVR